MTVDENVGKVMSKRKRSKTVVQALGLSALLVFGGFAALFGLFEYNNRAPHLDIPVTAAPANNGYDDFLRAGKLAKAMKHKSPLDMSGPPEQVNTYENYAACAPDAAPVQAAVKQGLSKPYLLPPVRSFNNLQFLNLALIREVARVLAGKARYEELSGHPEQSIDTLLDSMEMGVVFPRGGNLISGLVGIAVEAISIRPMEDLLPRLNAAQLAHVAARLEVIAAKRASYADIMQEEGNESTATLQEFFLDPKNRGLQGINNINSLYSSHDGDLTWRERLQGAKYVFTNKQAFLLRHQAYFKALADEARLPYRGASQVPVSKDPLEQALAGVFEHSRDKSVGMEAVMALLQTETALERYRLAEGHYPAELTQLVPAYLKAVPRDVCSGDANQPLRYASKAGGREYLLYSVGPDMRDDGGKPQKNIGDGSAGDIVARHLWLNKLKPVKQ